MESVLTKSLIQFLEKENIPRSNNSHGIHTITLNFIKLNESDAYIMRDLLYPHAIAKKIFNNNNYSFLEIYSYFNTKFKQYYNLIDPDFVFDFKNITHYSFYLKPQATDINHIEYFEVFRNNKKGKTSSMKAYFTDKEPSYVSENNHIDIILNLKNIDAFWLYFLEFHKESLAKKLDIPIHKVTQDHVNLLNMINL